MPDPFQLLHYSYDGQSLTTSGIRQLENNVTRALINTFARLSIALQRKFLMLFDPQLQKADLDEVQTGLQRAYHKSGLVKRKYLVFLTSELVDLQDLGVKSQKHDHKGRPDAWIHIPREKVGIAFESKLGKRITRKQIGGHLNALGWSKAMECELTWTTIASAAHEYLPTANELDGLLLRELINYLEILGMAPLYRWSQADFDALAAEEKSYVGTLRLRLADYAKAVRGLLPRKLRNAYPGGHVGNVHLSEQSAWTLLKQETHERDPLQHCNFSLGISSEGGWASAVVRNGRASEKRKALGIFHQALLNHEDEFVRLLRRSDPSFHFEVYKRTGLRGKGSPRRGAEEWTPVLDIQARQARNSFAAYLLKLLNQIEFPGITFGSKYDRSDMLGSELSVFAKRVARDVERAGEILTFLRKGKA